jgi:SAM-dependent methyltransferase
MYNRVLNRQDLEVFQQEVQEKNYSTEFPHIDLWGKDDAILKWLSVLEEVRSLNRKRLKLVDLGSGSGCTPHIIASWGYDVTAIDISNISHFCPNSLVKMVLNDVLIEIKDMPDASVDVFTDVCAVTHFNASHTSDIPNVGWKEVADQVYRVLKSKGKFIISSDVNIDNDFGEFIKPEKIIKIVESSGLKLKGTYDKESETTDFHIDYNQVKLQVVCLVFEK